jgi:NADH:ubiquinone oxidoreductase subunit 5 (subunit L)/multisubunit Na+/H+ antiporter MnhA subunit
MSIPLIILAIFSIFFGFIFKDIFIGVGSDFFSDNALFIHPYNEILLDTEFAVNTFYKLLPLILTILVSVLSIFLSEILPKLIINFKYSELGYNTFSLLNQRFFIELFYNKYITNIILKLGGQTTKVLDKGSIEYFGPFGLEKLLINFSYNLTKLDTKIITDFAKYILIALMLYLSLYYLSLFNINYLLMILLGIFVILSTSHKFIFISTELLNITTFLYTRKKKMGITTYFLTTGCLPSVDEIAPHLVIGDKFCFDSLREVYLLIDPNNVAGIEESLSHRPIHTTGGPEGFIQYQHKAA